MKNFANNGLNIINGDKLSTSSNMNIPNFGQMNSEFNFENSPNTQMKSFKEIADKVYTSNPSLFKTQLKKNDDTIFAENEIRNIKFKMEKNKNNKLPIWEKKGVSNENANQMEKEVSSRKKILDIKRLVKEKGGIESLGDLKNTNYFNKKHLDVIMESTRIVKEKALQTNVNMNTGKVNSLYNFVIDNREISMKNFLLDLLKDERSKILSKEGVVGKALKESENKLDLDYRLFEKFTEDEKNKQREMEKALFEAAKDNRELADRKKKLNQENKQIMDELDRTVKMILNLKGYASFVHTVMGDEKNKKFKDDINILDPKGFDVVELNYKDKDLEKLIDGLIEEFSYIEKEQKSDEPDILKDPSLMISTFMELEENILKLMDSKQDLDKETEKLAKENRMLINDMEQREKQVKKEREKLLQEKEKDDKIIRDLIRSTEGEGTNSEFVRMLRDLYCVSIYGEDYDSYASNRRGRFGHSHLSLTSSMNSSQIKPTFDIKDLMDNLRTIEFDVIEYVEVLDKISKEDEDKFKKIIYNRKEYNKFKKQEDQKKKAEFIANIKKEKAEERMHRVIVKGRNPMKHNLAGKGEKKKLNKKKMNKDNDDLNMLYYDYND